MARISGFKWIGFFAAVAVSVAVFSVAGFAQYKGSPVKKEKLINVLRSRQLQTREIVSVIRSNGVDFEVSPPVESELVSAGARPEVIAAAKANYRAPAVAAKTLPSKFTGEPLGKDAIVTLLQNGVADLQVRKNVQSRGVNFKPTAADKLDIKKAGGSVALVTLIETSFATPNQAAVSSSDTATTGSDTYNNLIDKAVAQYDTAKDTTGAITTLQQAVSADPNEARAYQQLGYMYLYGQKNFTEAEKYMRLAIERGGSAVFRVFHDHDGFFNSTCQGSLFIAKDTVRFESDDNKHTFETTDESIKSIKMNSLLTTFFKVKSGSFNFKLKTGETESKNYNFAPLTDNALESKMIIRLIGK
ncbi:MAG: SEL1-like repeat protein [Acidobacteria bacterium]|nr:SEL1-like repeat protein [Acidobacteriota bacterium]